MATVGLSAAESNRLKPCAGNPRAGIRRWILPAVAPRRLYWRRDAEAFLVPAPHRRCRLARRRTAVCAANAECGATTGNRGPGGWFTNGSPFPGGAVRPEPCLCAAESAVQRCARAQPFIAARPDIQSPPRIQINPGVVVAPLNANVILVAGVYGIDRQLMALQRVDWSLAPGSVGQIITVGDSPSLSVGGLAAGVRILYRPTTQSAKRLARIW